MGILATIILLAFLIFKSWLDSKLESGALDVTFISSQVQGYLNQNYSGLKFDFEKILLLKSENQEISILLERMQINSDRSGISISAANTELKNGLLSSIFGPLSELFNGGNFNNIKIYDPQIDLNLDILLQDLDTNLDREDIINDQNQVAYIDALEFGNQAATSHHFYQNRFKRLAPTLIIYVIVISILISLFIESGGYYYQTAIFSLFGISNLYLLKINSGYWGDDSLVNPFTNTWRSH